VKEFASLGEFAGHLAKLSLEEGLWLQAGLDAAAAKIEREAKKEFGHYQPATGPFPEWPELADSTQDRREQLGFTPNDPLLMTGSLRASISREIHGLDAVVGSTSDLMIYHEFGTSRMPARPVLGPAAYRHRRELETLVATAAFMGIIGARSFAIAELKTGGQLPVHESLGYDFSPSQ
jgi:HK97 gp10 family phage protein